MSVLVLSEHDVRELLDMESCIAAMEDVLARLARGELTNPLRSLGARRRHGDGLDAVPCRRRPPVYSLKEIVVSRPTPPAGSTRTRAGPPPRR